jgi:hypothetical protein
MVFNATFNNISAIWLSVNRTTVNVEPWAIVVNDHMVVGFVTTYAISAYHHWSSKFESHTWLGVLDITFCDKVYQWHAADLWFSPGTLVSFTNKTDSHDIAEILLKTALNTMTITLKHHSTNVGVLITGTMFGWSYTKLVNRLLIRNSRWPPWLDLILT